MSQREEKVRELHNQGFNCAQAFLCSYQDLLLSDLYLTHVLGQAIFLQYLTPVQFKSHFHLYAQLLQHLTFYH